MGVIIKKGAKIVIFILIIISCIFFVYWQNNHIVISRYEFDEDIEGEIVKIVQISDLHNKEFGEDNETLINKIKELEPDIIVLTGDFIDSSHTDIEVAVTAAEQMAVIPVYFITGNHELELDTEEYIELQDNLEEAGVHVLYNEVIDWNDDIQIIGLDDGRLKSTDSTLESLMEECDEDKVSVLLAHEPQEIDWYVECGADIVLSGHAHGGQIRIPFTNIGVVAPNQGLFPEYTAGIYTDSGTSMVVSRGLGNSILPLRMFNQPEIVEITIY